MEDRLVAQAQSEESDRFLASEERNLGPADRHRRKILNDVIHCQHGLDPDCSCARNFSGDKTHKLTEQQVKVGAASFVRSEMERLGEIDRFKYSILSKIIKCEEDKRDFYINQYEMKYGPLLTNEISDIDEPLAHLNISKTKMTPNSTTSSVCTIKVLDICQLGEPIETIQRVTSSGNILFANDQYLLIHNASKLCFLDSQLKIVRQIEWTHGSIHDICCNTKLNKFYMTIGAYAFIMDSKTMICEKLFEEKCYKTCACSDDILYLSTYHLIQKVLAYSCSDLQSVRTVFMCPEKQFIEGMSYYDGKLALVCNTRSGTKPDVIILSTTTYACLFSITIKDAHGYDQCRISSLGSSGWLVKDPSTYNIHHITENNVLRMTPMYDYGHPYNVIRFGVDYLVVLTGNSYNIHKLKYVPIDELTPSEVWKDSCRTS